MRIISMLVLAAAMAQQTAVKPSIRLAWDAPTTNVDGSPLTDLAGYKVYYGTNSGSYKVSIDVGNVTTTTVSRLDWNITYFFAATAYTTHGVEGDFSNEISWTPKRMGSVIRLAADRPPRRLWIGRE